VRQVQLSPKPDSRHLTGKHLGARLHLTYRLGLEVFEAWGVKIPEGSTLDWVSPADRAEARKTKLLIMGRGAWNKLLRQIATRRMRGKLQDWIASFPDLAVREHYSATASVDITEGGDWTATTVLPPTEVARILRYRSRWTGHRHFSTLDKDVCPFCALSAEGPQHDTPDHALFVCHGDGYQDSALFIARRALEQALLEHPNSKKDIVVANGFIPSPIPWHIRSLLAREALSPTSTVGKCWRALMRVVDESRDFGCGISTDDRVSRRPLLISGPLLITL
jgi:hypothetical protein